ncbi:hypothetical protein [Pseudacidobacterium ailaaui]|jgi:hypothetical protein|uniref:hypothetical protein n=1 Tax=Pseudacidobacterium ailaaui TaxID=1382359 RepID=UPI00047D660A|nr:hypothetical protein [Pseudacidobacterium ailaaui]MDI3255151.1 hypothetical protein [Bacillota bacterium]
MKERTLQITHSARRAAFRKAAGSRQHVSAKEGRDRLLAGTLPAGSIVHGSLYFSDADKPVMPLDLTVKGSLTMYDCFQVEELADGLTVEGDADFFNTWLKRVPRRMRVSGSLDLSCTRLESVPDDLFVGGGVVILDYVVASPALRELVEKFPHPSWKPDPDDHWSNWCCEAVPEELYA